MISLWFPDNSTLYLMVDMITRYEPTLSLWKATNKEQRDFLATSNAQESSLLIGVHNWTIYNDSKLCSLDSSYTTVLKMIGCSQKEFTCNNGICVDMATRCDGKNDCADESDEAGCKSFVQSIGYDRFKVPPPINNETKLHISVAIDIWDIVEINEKDGFYRCTILLTRKWIDQKVTFQNLQREEKRNLINPEDRKLLWKPWTMFKNIEDRGKYGQTDALQQWKVMPNTNFSFKHADKTFLHNTYLFDGASNLISYEKSWTVEWLCDFKMQLYPFDTQSRYGKNTNSDNIIDTF